MRKLLFTLMIIAVLACPAMAQRYRGFQLFIVDEFGNAVTNIDQIEIYDAGTSTTATIYSTRAGVARTNPITTTSGGFDQSLGLVSWFQAAADFKVTVTESGASQSLTVDNLTSTDTRFAWFVNYIGEAATLQITDDTTLDIGTGDDFFHDWDNTNSRYVIYPTSDGSGTLHFGKAAIHHDIYWHTGDITTDYVLWSQASANMQLIDIDLLLDDEAKLLFGDSSDVTIEYDESNEDLDILSTTALDEISFGATGDGYDLIWWGTTSGDYFLFDYSADAVLLEDIELFLGDGEGLYFGDTVGTGDFKISDEADVLTIDVVSAGVGEIAIGNDADDVPLTWYAETTSDFIKFTGDDLQLEDVSLCLGDGTELQFGDALGTGDIKVYATGTDLIIDGVVAETGTVAIGVTDLGIDFKLWAATNAEGVLWDASDEALEFTGANITLDSASILTLGETINADVVVTTGTYTVLAANSGKVHMIPDLAGATSIDLPTEADGLYYKFIYVGGVDEAHTHTIDSENDTNYFIGGVAFADTDAGAGADEINAGVYSDGNSNSKLAIINASAGTVVEIHCDGTNWYVTGIVFSATVPTFADQ